MKNLMTIVVPCYNEEEVLPLFMDAISPIRSALALGKALKPASPDNEMLDFPACDTELVFIDDGSRDCTLKLLREYHNRDNSVRYISFSRNFGKEAGIYAGLQASRGDYIVLVDADLQHPVEYIPQMYAVLSADTSDNSNDLVRFPDEQTSVKNSFDSVAMYRPDRKKSGRLRAFFSGQFYRIINRMSGINLIDGATDYRMMTRQMVNAVLDMQEYNRFSKGIFNWVGFETRWMPYEDQERAAGSSKWSFGSLLRYAFEGMFAFSTTPLTISFSLGIALCVLALIYALITIIKTLIWGDPVAGFPSLFTMILLLGGIQLLFLGIFGRYMAKMYLEIKKRPLFIERESSDTQDDAEQ